MRHAQPRQVLLGMLLAAVLAVVIYVPLGLLHLTSFRWRTGALVVILIVVLAVVPPRKRDT